MATITLVPSQISKALGALKFQTVPHSTTRLLAQVNCGGVVSRTVTVWLQVLELPHWSLALQVRVATRLVGQFKPVRLVVVLRMATITFVPSQMSKAAGRVKFQTVPHSSTRLLAQVNCGGVVSWTVTVWLQGLELPH